MLYDNKLAEYSRKRLEGYLAHKWGGASNLPSGHPFKNTAPDLWRFPIDCDQRPYHTGGQQQPHPIV